MTLLLWREHPAARSEYLDAVAWYDNREAGLGKRLADDLDSSVDFIRAWPDAAPPSRVGQQAPVIRRKNTEIFPYGIIYFVGDGEVVIVAYAHEKRRPNYWRSRLKDP